MESFLMLFELYATWKVEPLLTEGAL